MMKLVIVFPRPEVLVYTRPEAARAMHAALPWWYARALVEPSHPGMLGRLVSALAARWPTFPGDVDVPPAQVD